MLIQKTIHGAPEGQDARIIAAQARAVMPDDKVLIHVALDDARAAVLVDLIGFFAPDVRVCVFPAWDCLPYDRVSPNGDIVARRILALNQLIQWSTEKERYPRVLITTVNAISQRVLPQHSLKSARLNAQVKGQMDTRQLQEFFSRNGYTRAETVREAGEYAIRGGIIDIFPSGAASPVRMDLFGDEIESIRTFDPATQRTLEKIDSISMTPAMEFFMDDESLSKFRAGYRAAFGNPRNDDPLYEAVTEGRRYNGMDHWMPLFHEHMETIFDYAPNSEITMDHHAVDSVRERLAQINDFYDARLSLQKAGLIQKKKDGAFSGAIYNPLPATALYLDEGELEGYLKNAAAFSPFAPHDERSPPYPPAERGGVARKGRDFGDIRALPDGDLFGEVGRHIASLRHSSPPPEFLRNSFLPPLGAGQGGGARGILIACYSEGSRERMRGLMEASGIANLINISNASDFKKMIPGQIGLCILALESGFVSDDIALITEQDILGDRLARKTKKRKKADNFLREVSSLMEGDLVVHNDHGIGRFIALETVMVNDTAHDCLKIEYAGGDKLYVPVENIEILSRYGQDEGTVILDKLGGAGWQARKAKVKKDLMAIADHLLKIAAARLMRKADDFTPQSEYQKFAAKFPYQETEDQERAIADVIADLSKTHPMDRLVCGDVGFGKTEIAIRAAYIVASQGAQVAVAVPTTLLARQHYKNFQARFAGTGLRVEQLSRLVGASDSRKIKEGLADGSVPIVIGTHALFAKDTKFSNLGLVIVDEEQRFGVKQKERLKEIKNDVHILTLTATPIPRTLQMALAGVREMSIIATPPVDRLAIRTFVLPFDPMVVREAILREHYRGGQSFYVCPRIKDMEEVELTLRELVPEVKIISAHGGLPPDTLEDRMSAFYDGQYDVLLATNIIESGIDIPTANTMIVHRADMFGLAQLYQIRGRIGRSKTRAYAYMTYPPATRLTPQAQKRLEVLETLDTLGAGFQLASHDMDIRGGGNLLGEQQSGHIKEIGVELYQQMLEEAVAEARGGTDTIAESKWSPQINLGTSILIPEHYVDDLGVRMSLYRRLGDLETPDDIESFAAEMIDRFGPLPEEFKNLLDVVKIKQLCRKAGVGQIEAGPKGVVIGFHKDNPPNVPALMGWIASKRGGIKLRPDQKIVILREWTSPQDRSKAVNILIRELAGL
jgi:transcription-repair coupling factor (superfamily II helicase)